MGGYLSLRREYVIHFTTLIGISINPSESKESEGLIFWKSCLTSSFIDQSTMSIKFREEPCGESWDSALLWAVCETKGVVIARSAS